MEQSPAIWVDGEPAASLPLPDRGLEYGDGLFETLLLHAGRPLFEDLHFDRLRLGLRRLEFPDCLPQARGQLESAAAQLTRHTWVALRLTVTRGPAPRGYAPPQSAQARIVISAAPLTRDCRRFPAPVKLGWADIRWAHQPRLSGIKHLNRLEQVIAAREAAAGGWDDVVVLDQSGKVCSVSSANLFLVSGARLRTPPVADCGIAGTRRRLLLEGWARELGVQAEEKSVSPQELEDADEVIVCNSVRGFVPVASLGDRRWREHPVCHALHARFCESIPC